ncbi:MAG TPA: DNA-3-methyladenine glycosylase I, partial [Bacteroidia bacterium]|nr:DNA-3-methyladenine glycosylase I [Bacteroidia bacterium]
KAFLAVQKEFGTFDNYIWQFTDYTTLVNEYSDHKEVPAVTEEAEAMSRDLQKRGFKFTGATICYAFMQATGMVDDHVDSCWKRKQTEALLLNL